MSQPDGLESVTAAKAEYDKTTDRADDARDRLYEAIRKAAPDHRQVDIARITGWSREYIRQIVNPPTS